MGRGSVAAEKTITVKVTLQGPKRIQAEKDNSALALTGPRSSFPTSGGALTNRGASGEVTGDTERSGTGHRRSGQVEREVFCNVPGETCDWPVPPGLGWALVRLTTCCGPHSSGGGEDAWAQKQGSGEAAGCPQSARSAREQAQVIPVPES